MLFKSDKPKDDKDDRDNKPDGKITKSHDFPKTGVTFSSYNFLNGIFQSYRLFQAP